MRIVHLSDFHHNKDNLSDINEFILKALVSDLQTFNSGKKIDLLIISGDMIDKGGVSFGDINSAFQNFSDSILKPISDAIDLNYDRIFFCPGNHDIDRNADPEYVDKGLCDTLTCVEKINEYIDSNDINGIKKLLPFNEFEKEFRKDQSINMDISNFQSCYQVETTNAKVGIACFNSCWRCHKDREDKGNIILGERQITRARKIIMGSDLKIAVVHHPLDWLSEFDKKSVKNFILKDYDMIFFGHTHEAVTSMNSSFLGSVFVSVAPSNWTYNLRSSDDVHSNGYSVIDYDLNDRLVTVHNRKYYHKKEAFDIDPNQSKSQGITEYLIPTEGELSRINIEIRIATKIEAIHFDSINEHLLSYNTDTKAPKELDQLFVHPILESKSKTDPDDDEETVLHSIEELCDSDKNILILGPKESGKTVLVDKLLIEFTKHIYRFKQVPILCDFSELKGKRYETIISRFIGVGVKEINEFLLDHTTVLLVDNLDFSIINIKELNKLNEFVKKYKKLRIIATSGQTIEGQLPIDIVSFSLFSQFKVIHIKSFKTKEIKALIEIWFRDNDKYETPAKLNKIIDFFSTLNLPRTPLALSMLLWIIEQQENYRPINQAVMLENFIERLFKKQSKIEIYAETFDFTNKQMLLADVAKEMYDHDDENYRISYPDLFAFIESSLNIRRFDFSAEKVLEHFLDKGILVKESENSHVYIRFRFTCFFQYFLMKYMEYDQDFLDYVLAEDNYLYFHNEIDYYTGIKRNKTNILEIVIERMNNRYYDLVADISELPNTYDEVFLSQEIVSRKMGADFLKKLTLHRPNEKEIDELHDELLESLKVEKGVRKKNKELTEMQQLERYWVLASKVLKNTEETKIEGIKDSAYRDILHCSMAFAVLYKCALDQHLKLKHEKDEPINENLEITKDLIPFLHEFALFTLAGSKKLSAVIRDKIRNDLNDRQVSDFEKFVSVFLYSDLKGKDYQKLISQFVKKIRHGYIYDMALFKIVSYYFFRSEKENLDNAFENIIGDIIVKSKGRKVIKKRKVYEENKDKGEIILSYRRKRNKRVKEGEISDDE